MKDDEILAVASEVLVPAGLTGVTLRKAARPEWRPELDPRALEVRFPAAEPGRLSPAFLCWLGEKPVSAYSVRERAKGLVQYVADRTRTSATPWVPANQAAG